MEIKDRTIQAARQIIFEVTCAEMQQRLAAAGIPMLVLKGPHVGNTLYEHPVERSYCDLDVLVRPGDYFPAARVLLRNGFKLFSVDRRRLASESADYQLLLLAPRRVAVELHRALADCSQFRSDSEGFFQRAEDFHFGALAARGLGKEDLLLHLCLHFGKRHFMTSEKKHLQDIALMLGKKKIAWPDFLTAVRRARCRTITYYCLQAVMIQHGAGVPVEVMAALRPGLLRRRLLERYIDPAVFPVYRFAGQAPGAKDRWMNLILIDRFSTMIISSVCFAGRSLLNRLLRFEPMRRRWLKTYPLAEWLEF
jgi:hypothetical protein